MVVHFSWQNFHNCLRKPCAAAAKIAPAILFCACAAVPLSAQEKPITWGEVPLADLEMKTFPQDSNATAVILCDYGEVSFDSQFELDFRRHRRIKILSPAGYEWGALALPYYAKDRLQQVEIVEGQTFILEPNGTVRREKLDKQSIFDEDVDGVRRRVRFSLPALAPGAVVEYRYRLHSKSAAFLHDWEFQNSEPTRWSEFRAEIPSIFNYVIVSQELPNFEIREFKDHPWPITLSHAKSVSSYNLQIRHHRWAMKDMPALREEPFMTTIDDFRAKMQFQLASYRWPGALEEKVMDTWEKLAQDLMDSEKFGRQIDQHKILREQAQTLTAGVTDPEMKMRRIYDYARTTMAWDGARGVYANEHLDKVFRTRRGGGPEIALLLTDMLRSAGFDAYPVLISTRNHGRISDAYAMLSQFDHVLTYLKIGVKEYLLDATDPFRPHDMLPVTALNQTGWLVDKTNPRWISIVNPGSSENSTTVAAELSAEGKITGHFQSQDAGYSGLFNRQNLRGKQEEDFIREGWLQELVGAQLDSFAIRNRDTTDAPLLTQVYFSTSDHAHVSGDNIYLNPIFFGRQKSNPLKNPKRTFPVDFAYGRSLTYTLNLKLPEGYTVQELPRNLRVDLPGEDAQFRRAMEVQGNNLQILSRLVIRKARFQPKEYQALREFYDRIVAAHAEQVVLQRTPTRPFVNENVE